MLRIGVDTGGTFTDFVRIDEAGLSVYKVRTSPEDPTAAIVAGLKHLAGDLSQPTVVHGSTVATNAVLERKGARVALVTTSGFEDVLAIGRQTRPELYNIFVRAPRPLVDAGLIVGVEERTAADGREIVALEEHEVDAALDRVKSSDAEIVAVCFLHSYRNARHEARMAAALRAAGLAVSASHEVLPEYREFERWSTTVVNAYVTPLIDRYLARLEEQLGRGRLSIMQSNGGSISADDARTHAVRTVLSGPAAGVVGAHVTGRAAGHRRIISFDMGGTSTDVCLIDDQVPMTTETTIDELPVRLPTIDIHTVGAGGGSIARIDSGGALRVGPQSAGAIPGPVCYGTGTDLTVTDANLLLGRLDADHFLGGRMRLHADRTGKIAAGVARRLKVGVDELAEGIVRVVNASMERAIRTVSLGRGHDPRAFTLLAFGGAGGMHACEVAAELGIATVLVPRHAGVLSAFGMLAADLTRDYSATVLEPAATLSFAELDRRVHPLVVKAKKELSAENYRGRSAVIERTLDVRYVGQSYEISVPWSSAYVSDFYREHERLYGYTEVGRPVEVVAIRVRGIGLTDKPALARAAVRKRPVSRPAAVRRARFGGRLVQTAFYRWASLEPGMHAAGPAVITGDEATVVVPPLFHFAVDGFSNIVLTAPLTHRTE